ncbi:phosphotransferase family protein [Jeongeupia chitinilytica]|uniref:Aminoglycoside phosphotransferase n=1 Tax=Jeongeupia chitinilytica TaxID=1041641 RepID=A0ABQ3GU49_9NEIS|nr:phosphotransferase [Jeongeupia chitinilytica]GHD55097.1 aminoglycoside phosphotransferase [Jeongeupia chitinilytica]
MTALIGGGRTAEVFEHDESRVLKLFYDFVDAADVEAEFAKAQLAFANGVFTPEAHALVQHEGRYGIVYQRIAGPSLLRELQRVPWRSAAIARQMAGLHRRIHAVACPPGLGQQKSRLCESIARADGLAARTRHAIVDYTMALPDGEALCHGDFHPDNVLVGQGLWVIDWMTAARGHPACDVARTAMLLECTELPGKLPKAVRTVLVWLQQRLARGYVREYLRLSGLDVGEVAQWRVPNDAARLAERLSPEERRVMLQRIDAALPALR